MSSLRRLCVLLGSVLVGCSPGTPPANETDVADAGNALLYAVAWKQTAAEYRALYYQGFALAQLRVEQALVDPARADRPLAVISDLDETLLLAPDYWGYLVGQNQDFFDDAVWDRWVPGNHFVASPGAQEFLEFCLANSVEVFYVTNRDQGEATDALALANLQALGFPYADAEHLRVLRETSNKETVQDAIRQTYDIAVMLGDNLNDFSRQFYVADVDAREALLESARARIGTDYIVFPNPTDGHWIRAIFGESEPPPTAANRERLRQAAMRAAWQP